MKKPSKRYKTVSWKTILDEIEDALRCEKQWAEMEIWKNALKYQTRADVLIELLEVELCGSVGGFDAGQTDRTLKGRFAWLKERSK